MPRITEKTWAKRREHVLTSAWGCFSRNGFHATSMDDVIAATGMSSSAVYRYFRSKEELIDATAEAGLALVVDIFVRLLEVKPTPSPAQTLGVLVDELHGRTENPDYDLSRIAVQIWSEALRRPPLREHARMLYDQAHQRLTELTTRWKNDGHLPPEADTSATASVIFALMHGMIVSHHLASDLTLEALSRGMSGLGAALGPGEAKTPGA